MMNLSVDGLDGAHSVGSRLGTNGSRVAASNVGRDAPKFKATMKATRAALSRGASLSKARFLESSVAEMYTLRSRWKRVFSSSGSVVAERQ